MPPKKATPKKAAPKKATPKKVAPKKAAPKKAAPKKAAPKKAAAKKVAAASVKKPRATTTTLSAAAATVQAGGASPKPPPSSSKGGNANPPPAAGVAKNSSGSGSGAVDKVIKKGRGVVDPLSGKASSCRVLERSGVVYQCTLNQTNIDANNNKFYIIQALQNEQVNQFYLFTRWGRVGVPGQMSTEIFSTDAAAINAFQQKYSLKTSNRFGSPTFEKRSGKYQLMDIDYGSEEDEDVSSSAKKDRPSAKKVRSDSNSGPPKSKLPKEVQDIMQMISSAEAMSNTLRELEIDTKRMPLGKISKSQIKQGYECLKLIEAELKKPQPNVETATGQFYTLIPHDFGFRRPPLINSVQLLKSKIEMLDALSQLAISSTLLDAGPVDIENPLDKAYNSLSCQLTPLPPSSPEFQRVVEFATNTCGKTHMLYSLRVELVLKVNRHGEAERYMARSKSISNRQMLWHGSRTTNYMGILSQGLHIAPPEAPKTGYMFGKGIYLADTCSKSANYCFACPQNDRGLMLLCEAALGEQKLYTNSCYMEKAQPGTHSTKGVGYMHPDPAGSETVDGVVWPKGKMMEDTQKGVLLYPEYIIYDVAQCQMKYLIKMHFQFRK